jgi:hypothetical protein
MEGEGVKARLYLKNNHKGWCRWLMLIILATHEAEIRRIVVQSQQPTLGK